VLAFLRQPNVMDVIKERSRPLWSNTQLKNKITLIRSDGIPRLEQYANDVDLIMLLRYSVQGAAEKSGPLNFFAVFSATVWDFNTKYYSFIY